MQTSHSEIIKSESEHPTISQDVLEIIQSVTDSIADTPFTNLPEGLETYPVTGILKGVADTSGTGTIKLIFIIDRFELSLEMPNHWDNMMLSNVLMKKLWVSSGSPSIQSGVTDNGVSIVLEVKL